MQTTAKSLIGMTIRDIWDFRGYIVPCRGVLCEACGSIDVVRARTRPMDRVFRLFTGKNVFVCRRCGWRGRRAWSEEDRVERTNLAPESDPKLTMLDD